MVRKRVKISTVYKDFIKEIERLRKFDRKNQTNFQNKSLSKKQLHLLTETIFFSAFRDYENFIRDIFLLYTQEKSPSSGDKVTSYLNPIDFFHAEKLIKSSMKVVDWNSPDIIIARSELYLKDGFPVKLPYSSNKEKLSAFKKLRNHIAHNSVESMAEYKKVLKKHYGVIPLKIPRVGEYLLLTSEANSNNYNLMDFFDLLEAMGNALK